MQQQRTKSPGVDFRVPTAYEAGWLQARKINREFADNYVRHTTIGDPELDPVMDEIIELSNVKLIGFIRAGIEEDKTEFRKAPLVLRNFFKDLETPTWVDLDEFKDASRAFFANVNNMLIGYAIGSAIEGFSTLVSKSFSITGRVPGLGPNAVRRLQQNNRHMIEVYYPGGLRRQNDGWKVSTRIRFIHSRIRSLMKREEEWDTDAWGTPISAAHVGGVSLFTFSIRQFEHAIKMGSQVTDKQKDSIVKTWRYAGYLLGTPDSILHKNDSDMRTMRYIAGICEPPPTDTSLKVCKSVYQALPEMAGLTDPKEQEEMRMFAYRLSRALIGNQLADKLKFPKTSRLGVLTLYKLNKFIDTLTEGYSASASAHFSQLFDATAYDLGGIDYRMPDHVKSDLSSPY